MEELERLESLNLVAKVCTELENHIGISDKVLGMWHFHYILKIIFAFFQFYS